MSPTPKHLARSLRSRVCISTGRVTAPQHGAAKKDARDHEHDKAMDVDLVGALAPMALIAINSSPRPSASDNTFLHVALLPQHVP